MKEEMMRDGWVHLLDIKRKERERESVTDTNQTRQGDWVKQIQEELQIRSDEEN